MKNLEWEIKLRELKPSPLIFALHCLKNAKKVDSDEGMGIAITRKVVQVNWEKGEIYEDEIEYALLDHLRKLGLWAIYSDSKKKDISCMAGVIEQQGMYPRLGEGWYFEYTRLLELTFSVAEAGSPEPYDGYIRLELISQVRVRREIK